MNNTTISTATAAGTVSLSVVVLLQWLLAHFGISMPADVATAAGTLLTTGVHYLLAVHILPSPGATVKPITPPAPVPQAAPTTPAA
jgi:hypothetical protein